MPWTLILRSFKKWQNPWRSMGYLEAPHPMLRFSQGNSRPSWPLNKNKLFQITYFCFKSPFFQEGALSFRSTFSRRKHPAPRSQAPFSPPAARTRGRRCCWPVEGGYDRPGNFVQKEIHLPTIDFQRIFLYIYQKKYRYIIHSFRESPHQKKRRSAWSKGGFVREICWMPLEALFSLVFDVSVSF